MGRIAAVFPGQGSQYVGMAKDFHDTHDWVRERYQQAKEILGIDIAEASFSGPNETLVQTRYTQPAIFIHSTIVYDEAVRQGLQPDFVAGHSLGEYSALYAAGVLSFTDALTAVGKRAEYMQQACEANPGTMAAVIRLDYDTVRDVCEIIPGIVQPANHNSPEQIAISGELDAIETASAELKSRGARRVMPLPVGGAFHSPLMKPAPEQLQAVLDALTFNKPRIPVVPNVTATVCSDPKMLKDLLVRQITAPVLWYPSVQALADAGVDMFIELGPKNVLSGLIKKSIEKVTIESFDTQESLTELPKVLEHSVA